MHFLVQLKLIYETYTEGGIVTHTGYLIIQGEEAKVATFL